MLKTLQRADKYYDLKQFPQVKNLLPAAFLTSFKKPSSSSVAVHLGVKVQGVQFKKEWLKNYQAVKMTIVFCIGNE